MKIEYPKIEDFFISDDVVIIPETVEKKINEYINEYASEVERREFEAMDKSKSIFIQ